jgi:hypothetical protein
MFEYPEAPARAVTVVGFAERLKPMTLKVTEVE